jgi:hypothetical protein
MMINRTMDATKQTAEASINKVAHYAIQSTVKKGMIKVGVGKLAKGNVPAALATTLLEAGPQLLDEIHAYRKGEKNKKQALVHGAKHIAKAGVRTVIIFGCIAAGSFVAGFVGTVTGGLVGEKIIKHMMKNKQ